MDLSRAMSARVRASNPVEVVDVGAMEPDGDGDDVAVAARFWAALLERVTRAAAAAGGNSDGGDGGVAARSPRLLRVCVLGFMGPLWPCGGKSPAERVRCAHDPLLDWVIHHTCSESHA